MNTKWAKLVSDNFVVPRSCKIDNFSINQLTVRDITEDYEAVMTSIEKLKGTFDFYPEWPRSDMSVDEDLSNLGWHQTEFEMGTSFAYSVRLVDTNKYVGCVYLFPSNQENKLVDAYSWVRKGCEHLDSALFLIVKEWIENEWPFKVGSVNYPISRSYPTK